MTTTGTDIGSVQADIDRLSRELEELVLPAFTLETAWQIGSSIVRVALERRLGIAVDIRRPHHVLFHAALPGATADNDAWIERKAATAFRFESSTLLLQRRFAQSGASPFEQGWLDEQSYTLSGGAVPVVVSGAGVVAVATVSGLADVDDHAMVVDALRAHIPVAAMPPS